MRKFSIALEIPERCRCCGGPIDGGFFTSPGQYRAELPEGEFPTEIRLGGAARVTLAKGKLVIELLHSRKSKGTWALMPHYNPDAFGRVRHTGVDKVVGDETQYWQTWTVELKENFKPWYASWWAELKFAEVDPVTMNAVHGKTPVDNAAHFSVKLETLE
jgi:hypothetical protein